MTFDPLVEERVAPDVAVGRNEKGDPLIIPRGGTEAIPYTRASSLSSFLTPDPRSLSQWRARYGAQGIARYPDLAARVAAVRYSTGPISGTLPISERQRAAAEIDAAWEEAQQRMGIDEAANLGTAGHALTEPGNQGVATSDMIVDVVKGYHEVTASLERIASEVFVANDSLRAAGTFDSAYLSPEFPGIVVIGDTKTGKNYHQAEFEIQLAIYANSEVYQTGGGRLTFEEYFGLIPALDTGYLVHVSVTGAPKPRIVKLDLQRGWRLAVQAARARDARTEIDKVGVGEKFDHRAWNRRVLDEKLAELVRQHEERTRFDGPTHELANADQAFHHAAQELYQRFKHCWTESDTLIVKGRLG